MEENNNSNKEEQSLIVCGDCYINMKYVFGFSFIAPEDGYVAVKFRSIYDPEKCMTAYIEDKNKLAQFFLELDAFFQKSDANIAFSLNQLMEEVEKLVKDKSRHTRRPRAKKSV